MIRCMGWNTINLHIVKLEGVWRLSCVSCTLFYSEDDETREVKQLAWGLWAFALSLWAEGLLCRILCTSPVSGWVDAFSQSRLHLPEGLHCTKSTCLIWGIGDTVSAAKWVTGGTFVLLLTGPPCFWVRLWAKCPRDQGTRRVALSAGCPCQPAGFALQNSKTLAPISEVRTGGGDAVSITLVSSHAHQSVLWPCSVLRPLLSSSSNQIKLLS